MSVRFGSSRAPGRSILTIQNTVHDSDGGFFATYGALCGRVCLSWIDRFLAFPVAVKKIFSFLRKDFHSAFKANTRLQRVPDSGVGEWAGELGDLTADVLG